MALSAEEISWIGKVFRKIEMFSSLTISDLGAVIDYMEKYQYPKGRKIIKQGDPGDSFFIIYKGKVGVSVRKGFFRSVQVGELTPGQFFGEMALLSDEPRSATITAQEDVECFVLFKTFFQDLVDKNPVFQKMVHILREKRGFEIRRKT